MARYGVWLDVHGSTLFTINRRPCIPCCQIVNWFMSPLFRMTVNVWSRCARYDRYVTRYDHLSQVRAPNKTDVLLQRGVRNLVLQAEIGNNSNIYTGPCVDWMLQEGYGRNECRFEK